MYPHPEPDANQQQMAQQRVQFDKAIFVVTGTHNDITSRPYRTHISGDTMRQVDELTRGGTQITPSSVASIANQFIRPSATPQGFIQVPNQWDQARLRFMLRANYYTNGQLTNCKIIQGYTSHVGIDANRNIDPNMELYINTAVSLRMRTEVGPTGEHIRTAVESADHLLRGQYDQNMMYDPNSTNTHFMRPEDVFTNLTSSTIGLENLQDTRLMAAGKPVVKSRRANSNPTRYMANTLKTYHDVMGVSNDMMDVSDMANHAAGMVREGTISGDRLLMLLSNNSRTFQHSGFVTFGEMCGIFPEFHHIAHFEMNPQVERRYEQAWPTPQRGQTEYWTSTSHETVWATILSQSIPSLMMQYMLTQYAFVAHNLTLDGSFVVETLHAATLVDNLDLTPYCNAFISHLQQEVLTGLSMNNSVEFSIRAQFDVLGDTWISLSLDQQQPVTYSTPQYADGLYAPVLTTQADILHGNTHDLQALGGNLGYHHTQDINRVMESTTGGNDDPI